MTRPVPISSEKKRRGSAGSSTTGTTFGTRSVPLRSSIQTSMVLRLSPSIRATAARE